MLERYEKTLKKIEELKTISVTPQTFVQIFALFGSTCVVFLLLFNRVIQQLSANQLNISETVYSIQMLTKPPIQSKKPDLSATIFSFFSCYFHFKLGSYWHCCCFVRSTDCFVLDVWNCFIRDYTQIQPIRFQESEFSNKAISICDPFHWTIATGDRK